MEDVEVNEEERVPEEIEEMCLNCHYTLGNIDQLLKSVLCTKKAHMEEKLDSLEDASLLLLLTYTMNSLFWMYLSTQGLNPKEHSVKRELVRIQQYMKRAKMMNEKKYMSRVNRAAAKRFIRSALWDIDKQK